MRCYATYCGDNGGSKEERLSKAPVWRVVYFHWLPILIQFSIKPKLCVLENREEVCHDQLEITWSSLQNRSLCLVQADTETAIECWENKSNGSFQFELTATTSTNFQLIETETETLLADRSFEVIFNDKKYRRSRRNPWSFF